ncbi:MULTISPECIES: flagellar protein FliT [Pseudomonas]|uniref:Flagellar protein FliT n=1 Tax=Pseudomonas eucalypticola TaxID=2599595 RepID=A0A7D5H950_9PSED|nr:MULTISPECIES: flagellar protein FliT [Pseudomonas]QKZ07303.1 flagellar protein FliT [Pseudomonas eucalypticola]
MSQAQVVESYERLLAQSRRMHECAAQGDWAEILLLKSQGLIDEETLRRQEAGVQLDEEHRRRKFELIKQILELEVEVRKCLADRQSHLGALILAGRLKRGQGKAYRPTATVRPLFKTVVRPEV